MTIPACFLSRFGCRDKVIGLEKEHLIAPNLDRKSLHPVPVPTLLPDQNSGNTDSLTLSSQNNNLDTKRVIKFNILQIKSLR
jgi:hypothetical protein